MAKDVDSTAFQADLPRITQFLESLFGDSCPPGLVEIRLIRGEDDPCPSLWFESVDELMTALPEIIDKHNAGGWNIYFGVLPRPQSQEKTQRAITTLTCLWCDIDHLASSGEGLQRLRERLPELFPSWVIDSGHGLHCYWVLKEPVDIPLESDERYQARGTILGLIKLLDGDNSARDLSRILRVPGSWNVKGEPVLCSILGQSGNRFVLSDFDEIWVDPGAEDKKSGCTDEPLPDELPPPLVKTLNANNKAGRLWRMTAAEWASSCNGGDSTPSGLMFSLGVECAALGFNNAATLAKMITLHQSWDSQKHDNRNALLTAKHAIESAKSRGPIIGNKGDCGTESEHSEDTSPVWESPILFDDYEAADLPSDILPGVLGDFASAVATETETPVALPTMTVLGVLSTALATKYVVSPKPGWTEPLNTYEAVALPPGNNKSLVLKRAREPLEKWEAEERKRLGPEWKKQQTELECILRIIEGKQKKLSSIDDPDERQAAIEGIKEMKSNLPVVTPLPRLFCTDATPESLTWQVADQGGKFAIISDEGGIIEVIAGLYSGGKANIDILLKGWDGGTVRVIRANRDEDVNPFLTVCLVIQPAIIERMGQRAAFSGVGLVERFLYAVPRSRLGYRTHTTESASEILSISYSSSVIELLKIPVPEKPTILKLSPQSFRDWRQFQDEIEVMLRPDGELYSCTGWGAKLPGQCLRIAGLLHLATVGPRGGTVIQPDTMSRAIRLSRALIDHALAAFGIMGIDEAVADAKEIFTWIMTRDLRQFTRTDLHIVMKNRKVGESERLSAAIGKLVERNILLEGTIKATAPAKKPTTIYFVNPAIFNSPSPEFNPFNTFYPEEDRLNGLKVLNSEEVECETGEFEDEPETVYADDREVI